MDVSVMFVADTEIVGIGSKAIGRYLVVIIFRKFLVLLQLSIEAHGARTSASFTHSDTASIQGSLQSIHNAG